MRIAVLSDIHANREALDACLDHAGRAGAERFAHLGDYVGYGADPGPVLDVVRDHVARGAVALRGNHDEAAAGGEVSMNGMARAAIAWTRARLDDGQRGFLAALPYAAEEAGTLLVHANGWAPSDWGYVTCCVEAERSLARTAARVTLCGHLHVPGLYHQAPGRPAAAFVPVPGEPVPLMASRRWLAVIPAVGQPRDGDPRAGYALLDTERGTLTVHRVAYDVEAAAAKIVAAGLPRRLAERLAQGR
ncbi:metallophosphoesterase family protein [Salinarimonas soli]|uniref:Metallophosphoesterase family protein n=1 Tax=Salinarimonas soli TaxID=1638099 RepID=A0A5B2VVD7_9HYPH|nr:metallophosphoesterase family protein [Salinarimonas soli]KAA2242156.1 metallophosphoesterase family protein [Salinarimonas soli]